jgi:predicted metal-dependent hydrolase
MRPVNQDCDSQIGLFRNDAVAKMRRRMSTKKEKMARMAEQWRGQGGDPHYLGYFDCFNRGLFYEAHDVLEQLWLADRPGPNGSFYKGLIQLAGAFVHLQKNRLRPAAALFKLADANFKNYPPQHEQLNLHELRALIASWQAALETGEFKANPLTAANHPKIILLT